MRRGQSILAALLSCFATSAVIGQQTSVDSRPPAIFSIGQPKLTHIAGSALAVVAGSDDRPAAEVGLGVSRSILNPVAGLLGWRGEGYATFGRARYGLRAALESKALGLSLGASWNAAVGRVSPLVSFQTAVRRGGIVGHGSMFRVDWLPRDRAKLQFGLSVPLAEPLAGRTRPRRTQVNLAGVAGEQASLAHSSALSAGDSAALDDALERLGAYANAYAPRPVSVIGHDNAGYTATLARYDTTLRRMFARAAPGAMSSLMTALARRIAFDHLVLPLDSLFGQAKENPTDLTALRASASRRFAMVLRDSIECDADTVVALETFDAWTRSIERAYRRLLTDVQDSRFVWVPVEFALSRERFDEQREVDSILARAVGHPFTDQNALTYLRSSDLPLEIARSIYAAREYHVLWTHDFAGRRESGAIDNVSYSMVADAYLPALTAAVRRYDSTGALPAYIILQDEFFYEPRDNRLWMNILENPLYASMRLRGDTGTREAHLVERQRELREAVAGSARLQRDARASGDADVWIRDRVKVHVNIVEPSDFSFRSSHIVAGVPFTPDNIMRDHRKLVIYDLNERDPYRGALLLMGVGIGEHYASATWEDRGYRVRGPATLEARRALREALRRNGFREDQLPAALRPVEPEDAIEADADTRDYVGRALQVHNQAGFGRKESSVARAMLYNLAPRGSVIIVPDPMWLSDTWAGMLAAAAARGCRVYIIAPAAANAPSAQKPLLAVERRILGRLLELHSLLDPAIRRAGGDLRVGLFTAHAAIDDPVGRRREIREGLARFPWIRQVVPFDDRTLAVLEQPGVVSASGQDATALAHDEKPRDLQLHQKSQLIARPGAIAALLRQPGWDDALARSLRMQTEETARFADQIGFMTPAVDTLATRANDALLRGYEQAVPEAERKRVSFYFSVGTQNEDDRGIVSDAEATLIVSGVQASAGLVDLFTVMARSDWITTDAELARYVPVSRGWMSRLAWKLRAAF